MKSKSFLLTLSILIIPQILFRLLSIPYPAPFAIFTSIVILWISEIIPLPITAILVPVLVGITGQLPLSQAFNAFGNQILFLFLGSFLLAKAMEKHQLDKRIAYHFLSYPLLTKTVGRLTFIFSFACWNLSMWISNTAACAIMAPLALAVIQTLKDQCSSSNEKYHLTSRLLLTCSFASSIGGMATPVGSPPNLVALEFLRQSGIHVSFFQWILFGIPISLIMLILLNLLIGRLFPVRELNLTDTPLYFQNEQKKLGEISTCQWQVISCFLITVALWILPGIIQSFKIEFLSALSSLSMGSAAIMGSALLFMLKDGEKNNLIWEDARDINWGIILLFGGGLCLGTMLDQSGLAKFLGGHLFSLAGGNIYLSLAVIVVAGVILSEFSSNTASSSILIPLILATFALHQRQSSLPMAVAAAYGASFGFMLPVSTPPNAIIYGTGLIPLRQMIKSGIYFDLLGAVTIFLTISTYLYFELF